MLVSLLTLGSAVALGSNIAFRRQPKTLRHRLRLKTCRNISLPISKAGARYDLADRDRKTRQSARSASQSHISELHVRDIYQGAKKGFLAFRKVFVISMGGTQGRDAHLRHLAAQQGNDKVYVADRRLDRKIITSVGLMGAAAAGRFLYAPLMPIAGAATLIIALPIFRELSRNLRKGRVTTELIEIISLLAFLVTGYFFLATVVTFTGLLSLKLVRRTEQHSYTQLVDSFSQKPHLIWMIADGTEVQIPLEAVRQNDIVVVNTGEVIPVDGTVVEGIAMVDQHSLTGELQPVEKENGQTVFATTLVLTGRILIKAEHTGSDTNAAKIGQILQQTQDFKESLRLRGKEISDDFIAPTLFVSSLTLPFYGPSAAMAILWSGFGYNMNIFGPISVVNFLHIMANNGILIKDGRSLETLQQLDTVIFDKTGTLTIEQPRLGRIYQFNSYDEETLLRYAAAAEQRQSHPIAKAILDTARQRELELPDIEDAAYEVGYGIQVTLDARMIQVGSIRFMQHKGIHLPDDVNDLQSLAHTIGSSLVYVAVNDHLAGVLRMDPCIRPEAKRIVDYLKAEGIEVSIISGDQEEPTRRLAGELDVDSYYAETLPAQKAELIAKLRTDGKFVGYVGDGINDAIALKEANVSISLSGASTVATDTAQIILMDGDLARIESLFEISRAFEKNMQASYLNSVIPGVITLSGVFLLHMGLVGSLFIYFSSKLLGLANCMLPLVKDEMLEDKSSWKVKNDTETDPIIEK